MDLFDTLSGAVSVDILIIAAIFALFTLYGLRYGKSRSVALLLALYTGILAFMSFPYREEVASFGNSETQATFLYIAIFAVAVFLIQFVFRRFVFSEYPIGMLLRWFQAGLLAAGSTALLFAFAYHTLPVSTLYDFDRAIDNLFSSQYFFWWLIAPLGALFFTNRS